MAHTVREVHHRSVIRDDPARRDVVVAERPDSAAARLIEVIGGIIIALLGLRFMLALLGANRGSGFVNFIYDASQPFLAPFFGMFSYTPRFGIARFEGETLFAIVVYALLTWLLMHLVNFSDRRAYY